MSNNLRWKLVPVEATEAMLSASYHSANGCDDWTDDKIREHHAAILAAAPEPDFHHFAQQLFSVADLDDNGNMTIGALERALREVLA